MKETVYIRLLPDRDELPVRVEGEGGAERGDTRLADIAARARNARVVVFVPGSDVLLAGAPVPTRKRQRVRQALPYALEERLAGDIEALHFALGPIDADGTAHAAVVARERMERWLQALRDAGIEPDAIHPEPVSLPWSAGSWSLLVDQHGAVLRTGAAAGLALENVGPDELLELALADSEEPPPTVRLFDCREAPSALPVPEGVELRHEACTDALAVLAKGAAASGALDLLQGDYGRREEFTRRWRPWRHAAVLAAALLLVKGGLTLERGWELAREDERLREQIESLYRDTFPDARRVVNPRAQMEQRLRVLQGGGAADRFSHLLTQVAPVLDETAGLQLQSLRYRDGQLDVDLTLGNLQGLDELKQRLASGSGLAVEIASASAGEERVESRLTIREAGA